MTYNVIIGRIFAVLIAAAKKLATQSAPEALSLSKQCVKIVILFTDIATDGELSTEEKKILYDCEVNALKQLLAAAQEIAGIELHSLPSLIPELLANETLEFLGLS